MQDPPQFKFGETNKTKEFLSKFPLGKVRFVTFINNKNAYVPVGKFVCPGFRPNSTGRYSFYLNLFRIVKQKWGPQMSNFLVQRPKLLGPAWGWFHSGWPILCLLTVWTSVSIHRTNKFLYPASFNLFHKFDKKRNTSFEINFGLHAVLAGYRTCSQFCEHRPPLV